VAQSRWAAAQAVIEARSTSVEAGTAAEIALQEARVRGLQARQAILDAEDRISDLTYELADLLGLPAGSDFRLVPPRPVDDPLRPLSEYVAQALEGHPEILEARAFRAGARHGLAAARSQIIPEIGIMGAHLYQSSVPFFPSNTLAFGIQGRWMILDFGARRSTIREREAQVGQSEENAATVEARIRGEVEAAYRRTERSQEAMSLAREAARLRDEVHRLRTLEGDVGYGADADRLEAQADRMAAALDLRRAEVAYRLARAELEKAAGMLGG
jgi:outer membrane protein TolC